MQSNNNTTTDFGTFSTKLDQETKDAAAELRARQASMGRESRHKKILKKTANRVVNNAPVLSTAVQMAHKAISYAGHAASVAGDGIAVLSGDYTKIPDLVAATSTTSIKSLDDAVYATEARLHPVIPHLMCAITQSDERRFLMLLDTTLYLNPVTDFGASPRNAKLKVLALIEAAQDIFSPQAKVELDGHAEKIRRLMRSTQEVKASENRHSFTAALASSSLRETKYGSKILKISSGLANILARNEKNSPPVLPSYDEEQFCNLLQKIKTIPEDETNNLVAHYKLVILSILLSITEASTLNKVSEKVKPLLAESQKKLNRWIMKFGEEATLEKQNNDLTTRMKQ